MPLQTIEMLSRFAIAGAASLVLGISMSGMTDGVAITRAAPLSHSAVQDTGAKLYALTCATCHKANGLGVPDSVPPLAGSEWVTGSKGRMLRIVLGGLIGDMEVQGEFFNGAMPGWGETLSDADIAAVVTYARRSWGNSASAVSKEEVTEIRKLTAGRKTPWTADELKKIGGMWIRQ